MVVRGAVVPDGLGLAAVAGEGALVLLLRGVDAVVGGAGAGLVLQVVAVGAGAALDSRDAAAPGGGQESLPGGGIQVEDAGGDIIDEGAVVTGQQDRALPTAQRGCQVCHGFVVEGVGRLVQDQRGGAGEQGGGECETAALAG